jgi:hypothetical protein
VIDGRRDLARQEGRRVDTRPPQRQRAGEVRRVVTVRRLAIAAEGPGPERLQRMRALDQRARGQRHALAVAGVVGAHAAQVERVEQLAHRDRGRHRLVGVERAPGEGDDQPLPGSQDRLEQPLAVLGVAVGGPGDALACQQVEAHAATPTGPGAVVEPEQRDHARRHHASGREPGQRDRPGAPLGALGLVEARGQQQLHGRRLDGLRAVRPLLGQRVERVAPGATGEQLIRSVVDQLRHDVAEHVAPRPHRAGAAHRAHRVEDARARLGESAQPLGLAALDRIDRQRALPERAPVAGQSPAEQQPLQPEAPGVLLVGGERVRVGAVGAVEPPAHRALAHPAAQHVLRARVETEARGDRRQRDQVQHRHRVDTRGREVEHAQRDVGGGVAATRRPVDHAQRERRRAAGGRERRLDERRGPGDVGREDEDVARPQRRVGIEQGEQLVAQHLRLAHGAVAGVQAPAGLVARQLDRLGGCATQQLAAQHAERRVRTTRVGTVVLDHLR